jgi:hypothetical protein
MHFAAFQISLRVPSRVGQFYVFLRFVNLSGRGANNYFLTSNVLIIS